MLIDLREGDLILGSLFYGFWFVRPVCSFEFAHSGLLIRVCSSGEFFDEFAERSRFC